MSAGGRRTLTSSSLLRGSDEPVGGVRGAIITIKREVFYKAIFFAIRYQTREIMTGCRAERRETEITPSGKCVNYGPLNEDTVVFSTGSQQHRPETDILVHVFGKGCCIRLPVQISERPPALPIGTPDGMAPVEISLATDPWLIGSAHLGFYHMNPAEVPLFCHPAQERADRDILTGIRVTHPE